MKYTFIVNYFVDFKINTEIRTCSVQEGMRRIEELKSQGFELSEANYGFYDAQMKEIKEAA